MDKARSALSIQEIMEIQGAWVPREILRYIASFLLFNDDWNNYCAVFAREGTREWARPLRFEPVYTRKDRGFLTTVKSVRWIGRFTAGDFWFGVGRQLSHRTFTDAHLLDYELDFRRGDWECYGGLFLHGNVNELPAELRSDCCSFRVDCDGGWPAVRDELARIYEFLCAEIPLRHEQLNNKNVLTNNRPRKRVKRLGFLE